jgi:FAD:protein FMN transferase
MKETRIMMGMPVTIFIADKKVTQENLDKVFTYFQYIDEKFSTYKTTSEINAINRGELYVENASGDMQEVFRLSEETKKLTNGYFNIQKPEGKFDPSGLVKGWAIFNAAKILERDGFQNYYVDAGGDIQVRGINEIGTDWTVGVRDPFDKTQQKIVKVIHLKNNEGIATSGNYIRGDHIYNPLDINAVPISDIVSLTVIAKNVYEADRFATAAFAMGKNAIYFIESLDGFEGYMIDKNGIATMTTHFDKYL